MITRIRQRFLNVRYNYANPLDYQRASGLLVINTVLMIAWAAWLFGSTIPSIIAGNPLEYDILISLIVLPIFVYISYRLVQGGRAILAAWLLVTFLSLAIAPPLLEGITGTTVILFILPIVASAVLLSRRGTALVAGAVLLTVLISAASQSQITTVERYIPAETAAGDLILVVLTLSMSLAFLYIFGRNPERIVQEALLDVDEAQSVAGFGAGLSMQPAESAIVAQANDVLRNRLGYAYAEIYLMDEMGNLRPQGGGSPMGNRDAARVGSALRQAVRTKQAVIVSEQNAPEQRAHLLPSIRSGMVVPLLHEGTALGVVDVQNANQNPFSSYDISLLSLLADQITGALVQARTIADLRTSLETQQAASERLQTQLLTYQQSSQQVVENAWVRYLQGRGKVALGFDLDPDNIIKTATAVPEAMRATLEKGRLQVEQTADGQIINVPIQFRDHTLGAMSFTVSRDQQITERQLEMAQVVSSRLALALENTRLFEQSQAQVLRERKASEVANLLIGATDVATVLNLAAESFNEALGAIQTRIYVERETWAETLSRVQGQEEAL